MKGGNGKTDELTFEQPEEIAVFRKSKTGRFSPLYDFKPGAFAPKKVVPRVKLCSRLSFLRKTGFFYCLPCIKEGDRCGTHGGGIL